MEGSEDKQWASKYLLDPLTAPEPSDETGPGTHHVANTGRASKSPKVSRKVVGSGSLRSSTDTSEKAHREKPRYPTPPDSSRSEKFPDFDAAYNPPSNRFSTTTASTQIPTSTGGVNSTTTGDNESTRPRRTSSLSQRYPGDTSHRPLDMLRKSDKAAHRSPHLRKQHHVGADTIDNLDTIAGTPYHHEGPYDAAMTARNRGAKNAPLAALAGSNAEALRATPREKVLDALEKHYPLDGTAVVPPGMVDREGRLFKYEEGTDMMRELNPGGGPYRRWAHVQYLPEDLKGKGEPSYSLERALKTHKRHVSESVSRGIEMMPSPTSPNYNRLQRPGLHQRASSTGAVSAVSAHKAAEAGERYVDWERGGSVKRSESGKLRKRIGSLKING